MKHKKAGQPTLYKPEYCEALIEHLKNGDSYTTFAAYCNVSIDTLYNWEELFPKFSEAKRIGWAHYQKWWEDAGKTGLYAETFKDGDGMTVSRNINPTLWIYNMKCRFRNDWMEKKEIHVDATVTNTKEQEQVEAFMERIKKLQALE